MAEFINNSKVKRKSLLELGLGMLQGQNNPKFVSRFDRVMNQVTPRDIIYIVDGMVQSGQPMEELKKAVSKVINLMYIPLKENQTGSYDHIPFIKALMDENHEMEMRMKEIKIFVKTINISGIDKEQLNQLKSDLLVKIQDLEMFDRHYIRKENILFPYLENIWQDYRCLQVMWSLHDDARKSIRELKQTLQEDEMPLEQFNKQIGELFFSVYPLIYREENILFPVAVEEIPQKDWALMHQLSSELGYAWIDQPIVLENQFTKAEQNHSTKASMIDLDTGMLEADDIIRIFNHMPVDITYVDENDEVRYFSNSENRHFPRSKAIIGRKVQNCHPPESIDIVNRIVEAFRKGEKDEASFWIQMKGMFILIQYFAVRDEEQNYKGVVEISQDVTEIRKLEGERRLLDW
ncbi:MAG: DUF438 domain-containing protein [Bacteroidales bacterium]|nr:DUF438 domain-containing protein [Bacteroidales bacterium]